MTDRKSITPEVIKKLLSYNPYTGELIWTTRPREMFNTENAWASWNGHWAGKLAFTSDDGQGYRGGSILKIGFRAHRVAWAIYYGEWPHGEIDHINGNRSDNRISNLRVVEHMQNGRNQKRRSDNVSGATGVNWHKRDKIWHAKIKVDGKSRHIGSFHSFEDAVLARQEANKLYIFHGNHGHSE